MRRSRYGFYLSLAMSLVCGGTAWGAGAVNSTPFNLSTPGARSLGMGGAFLGLADDATAAYSNPAGLTSLTEGGPQIAVELRNWSYSTPFISGGRLDGTPQGRGLDFFPFLLNDTAQSNVTDLSFASFGYVLPGGITFALYKNQLANYSAAFQSEGFFYDTSVHAGTGRTLPSGFETNIRVDSIGLSMAYEFRKPFRSNVERPLSIGIGVARYHLNSATFGLAFNIDTSGQDPTAPDGSLGHSQFLPGNLQAGRFETGDDSAVGLISGFLWKLDPKGHWRVGGVYREGPKFRTKVDIFDLERGLQAGADNTLKIPDTYGFGVSYSPGRSEGETKIAFDYVNSRYSQRFGDFFDGTSKPNAPDFAIPDAQGLHLGLEQVVVKSGEFVGTVRAGAWRESAHEFQYKGSDPTQRLYYATGGSDTHWTAGLGLVIGEQYQIDAAMDRSDRVKTFSFSLVRFF